MFDKKYTIILSAKNNSFNNNYYDILNWLNTNCKGMVDIKESGPTINPLTRKILYTTIHYAFENDDDAIFFKIKYPLIWL